MTGQELIRNSLRLLGVLASGENPTDPENQDALVSLNDMLDSWSNENLMIYHKVQKTLTLTAGQQSYTIGSGGDFDTTRPMKIEDPAIRLLNGSDSTDFLVKIISQKEFQSITEKDTDADIPQLLYYEDNYPLGIINLWPKPNASKSLLFYSWEPLSGITLTGDINLPPGYLRCLRYNLACELAPEFGMQVSERLDRIARESKGVLKVKNDEAHYLRVDAAVATDSDTFNWSTGE